VNKGGRLIAATALALLSAIPALRAETVTRAGTFGDWTVMTDGDTPHRFCFVTSEPKSAATGTQRDAPRAYISAWPKDGIKGEVSFRMGFPLHKGSEGTASVSPSTYKLFGAKDRAYVTDSTQELKLVEAMRKGSTMTVAMPADQGASIVDTYSLNGIGLALQKLQTTCF
jgi:hypothetical protein